MNSDELKAAFAALPEIEPVEPDHSWRFWAWDLRQNVKALDPAEFLTWPGVVGTMFVGNAPYIDWEYDCLPKGYIQAVAEPNFGKPTLYHDGLTSGNLIHQAYHLWQTETWYRLLCDEIIIEIGGGYGAMALICRRLGFTGRYIILDIPEFSLLQQYYLSNVGINDVECLTRIDEPLAADLLIALYSLSEMSLSQRARILDSCLADNFLIAYAANWGGWDNIAWAGELMKQRGYIWKNYNIEHLPNCWYLTGNRTDGQ